MAPENAPAVEPAPQGMSEIARLTGVFFEPKKTFEDIVARPTWLVPMLLVILFGILFMTVFSQHVGWEAFMRHQVETSSRGQQLTPEQREQALPMQIKVASIFGYAIAVVGPPIGNLIVAGVLLGVAAGILSVPVKFKQMFAIVSYAALPGVIFAILAIIVMLLKNPADFNLNNPLVFNPGAVMDPDHTSKALYSIAASFDLFTFWTIFLQATGIKAAGGKRLSFAGALFAVILPWALWVLIKAGSAAIFS